MGFYEAYRNWLERGGYCDWCGKHCLGDFPGNPNRVNSAHGARVDGRQYFLCKRCRGLWREFQDLAGQFARLVYKKALQEGLIREVSGLALFEVPFAPPGKMPLFEEAKGVKTSQL